MALVVLCAALRTPAGCRACTWASARGRAPACCRTGRIAEVRRALEPLGSVYAAGEEWTRPESADGRPPGARARRVRVVGQDGLTLIVEPVEPAGSPA